MSNSYRVLVVEDEPLMRDYLIGTIPLLHPCFAVVDAAHDGVAALALFEQNRYDLVITDLRMPGMDGLQLIEDDRKHDKRREHSKKNAGYDVLVLPGKRALPFLLRLLRFCLAFGAQTRILIFHAFPTSFLSRILSSRNARITANTPSRTEIAIAFPYW